MQDNKTAATVLRTLSIVILLLALGILGARIFTGLDVPLPSIMGLITVGIALLVVAQSNARKGDKPD